MDSGRTASRFRTTSWTLILRARESSLDLEELLRRYTNPIYAYIRRTGHSRDRAEDLTQAFLLDVVLRRDLIGRADRDLGSFRSFVLTALRRFLIDDHRAASGRPGGPRHPFLYGQLHELRAPEPSEGDDAVRAFDRQWAVEVFQQALERAESACTTEGMASHWRVFEARILWPMLHGAKSVPVDRLLRELGLSDRQAVYDMLATAKHKVRSMLREVVAETVDDADVNTELLRLRHYL